ncbi:hypothetical protein HC028_16530 [Planosporangium flavigriseum]|uniref:Uncharacterized protein n=1 Tax=Planosporangium flavigriseum TaxID=373681 RepID=A0A8J3LSX5_9ACTN|nr:hypothetical protein [Planosporangium flavigriseum]NJC66098.1 hypothetical protein [Planosporangium flavigriseum]GIG76235.1 hypothetical protein Pfl04_46390 [Planosporangium flavigriseum]
MTTPRPTGSAGRPEAPVEIVRRWQESGAVWRVVSRTPSGVSIALLTCDGGEEVHRLVSSDPDLIAFIGARSSSEL